MKKKTKNNILESFSQSLSESLMLFVGGFLGAAAALYYSQQYQNHGVDWLIVVYVIFLLAFVLNFILKYYKLR
jgi:hypothetical protein